MNDPRDRNAIIVAWLEDGPTDLPEATRRAITVGVRSTHQAGRPWRTPWTVPAMVPISPVALVAVIAIVMLGGLAWFVGGPDGAGNVGGGPSATPSASPSPSPSPSLSATAPPSPADADPTAVPIPPMTETHVSLRHGYSIRYPADWSLEEATASWSPPAWKAAGSPGTAFDYLVSGDGTARFRVASAPVPASVTSVNDWIDEFLIFGNPACVPPRAAQELMAVDAAPGRLWENCGEVEATVVLEGRVYMFTLILEVGPVANGRALFDAFAATVVLRPGDAVAGTPSR